MDTKELTVAETVLPTDSEKTIAELTSEIQYYLVQMGQNAIEVGKRLILAKAKLSHGEWQNWLADNFNLSYRMAARFMAVAERFSKVTSKSLFSQTQMVEMLSLPEVETEKFIEQKALEGTPVDAMPIKKLREEIKKYKTGLSESKQEKNVAVEMADSFSTAQVPVVLNALEEFANTVTAEKVEVADVDVEIPNGDIKEKLKEMSFECSVPSAREENFVDSAESLGKSETSQVLKQSQSDIPEKEKANEEDDDLELLEQFFKFLPLILTRECW